ncbi:AAA family ATPase [Salmonella enterica]|nr:AAA family ATPase [Salmonella enterica]EGL4359136.1 AAA family ATPase [Salmonella enterica]EGL4381685.1 AAA family ATPase [Salmonella enterica]EGL4487064.1 AAA family ATPase [Salmonella enterica]EGL4514275.1 AAA family ATPase [Salmonella enterica]
MLLLKQQLQHLQIDQREIAGMLGISEAAVAQLVNHGRWPRRKTEQLRKQITELLASRNVDTTHSFDEVRQQATTLTQVQPTTETEDNMLLKKQTLSQKARKAFNLFRNPFDDTAIQSADDVFTTPDIRYVREAMYQTATHGGMLAIWGESGSGKSTLRRDLIDRLQRENSNIIVIEPYVLAMEDNDRTGKTLKAASIAEAILRAVSGERPKQSPEARFAQVHQALKDSADGDSSNSHVLIIEEAHSLPIPTLKHLKRFLELESGFKRLLSIILIGQQELCDKLSERRASVREVVQRCELVQLEPLNNDLEAFLAFKLTRAGKKPEEVLDASAIPAIVSRMTTRDNKGNVVSSILYPLAVGNLMIAAMNAAAEIGVPVVNGDIIKNL